MNKLKAVFWDVDGTLADTEMNGHRKAFNQAFKIFNLDWVWDKKLYKSLLKISGGHNRIKHYSNSINYDLNDTKLRDIQSTKQYCYNKILKEENIPLRIGVKRLLKELFENKIQQWIVTTSGISAVNSLFQSSLKEEINYFSGFITSEDVKKYKPDPSAYLLAVTKSKIQKDNIIVIEDSIIGLKSAVNAKLSCLITVSPWNTINKDQYKYSKALVNSLGDKENRISNYINDQQPSSGYIDLKYLEQLLN
tara:strand:+ start:1049 stop:1798 length:750 start_codon:yes stop_codon:yes gene_type:complete